MVKIENIELTEAEASEYIRTGKRYLVTYSRIYYIDYSVNAGYHGSEIYRTPNKGEHLTRRGRFYAYNEHEVNHLIGFNLLSED